MLPSFIPIFLILYQKMLARKSNKNHHGKFSSPILHAHLISRNMDLIHWPGGTERIMATSSLKFGMRVFFQV